MFAFMNVQCLLGYFVYKVFFILCLMTYNKVVVYSGQCDHTIVQGHVLDQGQSTKEEDRVQVNIESDQG